MLPLVAQLGMALLSKKMQDDDADRAYRLNQEKQLEAVKQGIADRRAARAGDAGYMQQAMAGMNGGPSRPDSGSRQMLAQLGAAILSHQDTPDDERLYGTNAQTKLRRSDFY